MNYAVIIKNNSNLVENGEFLHTWLEFRSPDGETKYFSFGSKNWLCTITKNCTGVSTVCGSLKHRNYTEEVIIPVSKENYIKMWKANEEFYKSTPDYCLMENGAGNCMNCTIATRKILNAGGIKFLDDVKTPKGVASKTQKHPGYEEHDDICAFWADLFPTLAIGAIALLIGGVIYICHDSSKKSKKLKTSLKPGTSKQ